MMMISKIQRILDIIFFVLPEQNRRRNLNRIILKSVRILRFRLYFVYNNIVKKYIICVRGLSFLSQKIMSVLFVYRISDVRSMLIDRVRYFSLNVGMNKRRTRNLNPSILVIFA